MLLPGAILVALCSLRGGPCLDAYRWDGEVGLQPTSVSCDPEERPGVVGAVGFYGRFLGGLATLRPGRSREDTTKPLTRLLGRRAGRSAVVVAVAAVVLGLHVGLPALLPGRRRKGPIEPVARPRRPIPALAGLPLPIVGFALFAAVVRLVPPDHPLDLDQVGFLWAGLALAWADGVAALLFSGLRHASAVERARPWAESLRLQGGDAERAVADTSAAARTAQLRGAALGLLGGLLVVEGVFRINGLGETLRDLVVDRRGLDPLLLCGVLLLFSLIVVCIELLPLQRLVAKWRT